MNNIINMLQNSNPLGFNNRKSLDDYENYDISEEHHKKINIDMQDILNHSDNDIEFDIENIQELKDDLYNEENDANDDIMMIMMRKGGREEGTPQRQRHRVRR